MLNKIMISIAVSAFLISGCASETKGTTVDSEYNFDDENDSLGDAAGYVKTCVTNIYAEFPMGISTIRKPGTSAYKNEDGYWVIVMNFTAQDESGKTVGPDIQVGECTIGDGPSTSSTLIRPVA